MKKRFISTVIFIVFCFMALKFSTPNEVDAPKTSIFYKPIKSPFINKVGINFSVEQAEWFIDPSIKYNQELQREYTYGRLFNISRNFKLIRIYSFLVAGWEQTGVMSAEGYSIVKLVKENKNIEAVLGTSNRISWFMDSSNVQMYVDTIKSAFGSSIYQVKTILIGNEINANGFNSGQLSVILKNFRKSLKKNKLNIPVTVSFNNLPIQSGDTLSDNLVNSVVKGWDSKWNSNKPFVFIDPYPDANGIGTASGVYRWQYNVTKYYNKIHPSLQIFIGETGGEGCDNDYKTTVVINNIFNQLSIQYDSVKTTVPTFLFEALNESLKPSSPEQKYMGLYVGSAMPKDTTVILKVGIKLPTWFKK